MSMVEIHNSVAKVYEENIDTLEIFECLDEFSDTQNFCDHYGFDIEDSCNAILIKAKKPDEFENIKGSLKTYLQGGRLPGFNGKALLPQAASLCRTGLG